MVVVDAIGGRRVQVSSGVPGFPSGGGASAQPQCGGERSVEAVKHVRENMLRRLDGNLTGSLG